MWAKIDKDKVYFSMQCGPKSESEKKWMSLVITEDLQMTCSKK